MVLKGLFTLLMLGVTSVFFPTKLYASTIIECSDCTAVQLKEKVELYALQNDHSDGLYVLTLFDPVKFSIQDAAAKVMSSQSNDSAMPNSGMDASVSVNLIPKSSEYLETEAKLRSHHAAISYVKRMVVETFEQDPNRLIKSNGPLDSVADALKDKKSASFYIEDLMRKHHDLIPEKSGPQLNTEWAALIGASLEDWINDRLGFDDEIVVYIDFPDGTVGELKITISPATYNYYEVTTTGRAWFANGEMLILNNNMLALHGEITPDMIHIPSLVLLMNSIDGLNVADPSGIGLVGDSVGLGSGCVRIIDFLTDPLTGNKSPYIAVSGC